MFRDGVGDQFLLSHGVRTPSHFWKIILTNGTGGYPEIISWLIPNDRTELGPLDSYLVSVDYIEAKLTDGLGPIDLPPFHQQLQSFWPSHNWPIPTDCNRS